MEKPCDAKKEEQQKKRDKKVHSPSMTNYKTLKRSSTTPQAWNQKTRKKVTIKAYGKHHHALWNQMMDEKSQCSLPIV